MGYSLSIGDIFMPWGAQEPAYHPTTHCQPIGYPRRRRIEFELVESGERFRNKVKAEEDMDADFVVNSNAGVVRFVSMGPDHGPNIEITLSGSGKKLQLPM